MPLAQTTADSLAKLLDNSDRPTYVVDAGRRIVYGNPALTKWIDLPLKRIINRRVEFHSEEPKSDASVRSETAPLTDLCPPPYALAGEPGTGTISCLARDGRMLHRAAEFVPLGPDRKAGKTSDTPNAEQFAVLVLLATEDLSPQAVAAEVSSDPTADELHRTIRRFRRSQAQRYTIKSLLGPSAAMQKVRSQVEAAANSRASVLIIGRRGSGRAHIALAIHYRTAKDDGARLVRLDCELLTDSVLEHELDRLRPAASASNSKATLLLENLERLASPHQALLLQAIQKRTIDAQILATYDPDYVPTQPEADATIRNGDATSVVETAAHPAGELPRLVDVISTITIRVPRLADRLEDLPILAQYCLEACNQGSSKQIGELTPEALDRLALYSWPGEISELQAAIEAAHANCGSHQILAADLPPTFFHAARAAMHSRRVPERIVLDDLLATIEKEAITRALAQAGGNKSEAAALLGMTRPRLYRRLVQLGLVAAPPSDADTESPEFIEQDTAE